MTDTTGGAAPAGGLSGGAASGTPDESDLPRLQGLDADTDDLDDPAAAQPDPDEPGDQRLDFLRDSGSDRSASDPMPDMSGNQGT